MKDLVLKQISRVSPSRYAATQSCLLREVWHAANNEALLPPSPTAELGRVIHQLLEMAGRGQLADTQEEQVDAAWTHLIMEAENQMSRSQLRRLQVPLCKNIPDFEVRRLRSYRQAREIAQAAAHASGPHGRDSSGCTGFELWIETDDGSVGGYIDRARRTEEGIVLLDYKSGAILERESNGGLREVKAEYQDQMQLYAALYQHKFGEWPVHLDLVPPQGPAVRLTYKPASAEQLLANAKGLLRDANRRIAEVQSGISQVTSLASPCAGNCRLCMFRPACQAYWVLRQHDSIQRWPYDVKGILRDKTTLRTGTLCLRIAADCSLPDLVTIRNVNSSPERHPLLESYQTGSHLAVYGLQYQHRSKDYTETQNTVIYQTD